MAKKRLIPIVMASIFLFLTSCGFDYSYSLDNDLFNQIECIWEENNPSHIIYHGDMYLFVGTTNFFDVETFYADRSGLNKYGDDILLSWNGPRYWGYRDLYLSYTKEKPLFIYNNRMHWVFFREDYNYSTDTFIIADTNEEIVWKDMFDLEQNHFNFVDPIKVVLCSKQHPRIKTYLELVCIENQWYLSLPDFQGVWTPSDEFISILSENKLI